MATTMSSRFPLEPASDDLFGFTAMILVRGVEKFRRPLDMRRGLGDFIFVGTESHWVPKLIVPRHSSETRRPDFPKSLNRSMTRDASPLEQQYLPEFAPNLSGQRSGQ